MKPFDTAEDCIEFVRDALKDSQTDRNDAARYAGRCRSYDCGVQWITEQLAPQGYYKVTRQMQDWVGASGPLRATVNRVTRFIRQITAITNPEHLEVDGFSGEFAQGMGSVQQADICEVIANTAVKESRLVSVARRANFERVVAGDAGIGLHLERSPMVVTTPDGQEVEVQQFKLVAFEFDAYRLSLDPFNSSADLRDHEYVIYSDIYTEHKLKRLFGDDVLEKNGIDREKLKTVAQLAPLETEFYRLSGGRLYANYHRHSGSKGARVHHLHMKDDSGEFRIMYVLIEAEDREFVVVNMEDPVSPFGGDGLPYIVLRAHPRAKSRLSISDVGMMLDDQDKLNLIASVYFQQLYNYTHRYKIVAHKSWFGSSISDDDIKEQIDNQHWISDRSADRQLKPPQIVGMPNPDTTLDGVMRQYGEDLREQSGRPEIDQGRLKTHVSGRHATYSVERTQMVLDDRIAGDVIEYQKLINVVTGTAIIGITAGWPDMMMKLQRQGFTPDDIQVAGTFDPHNLPCELTLRNQGVRQQSREARRQNLSEFAAAGAIDPRSLPRIMARDLDMPLSDLDKIAVRWSRYQAGRVALGEEWQPVPLGEHSDTLISEFYRAMMDKRTAMVPGAVDRLSQAILDQRAAAFTERAVAEGMAQGEGAEQPPEDDELAAATTEQMLMEAGIPV